jgi:NDP-sugar pyrophosphorylase family protein
MRHWLEMAGAGRLHGAVMDGRWMHVGDPEAWAAAEAEIARAGVAGAAPLDDAVVAEP